MQKKTLISGLAILTGLVLFYYFYIQKPSVDETAYEFRMLKVEEIIGDSIIGEGLYVLSGKEPGLEYEGQSRTKVEMVVGPETAFNRTKLIYPSEEELEKNDRRFNLNDLEKVEETVDFEAFKNDISELAIPIIFGKASKNIYNKNKFEVKEINYSYLTNPQYPGQQNGNQ